MRRHLQPHYDAKGMGELDYYGHPKTVNKSVAGIGSVNARD